MATKFDILYRLRVSKNHVQRLLKPSKGTILNARGIIDSKQLLGLHWNPLGITQGRGI